MEKEEEQKQKQEERKERIKLYNEWKNIQGIIYQLCQDMSDKCDESMKADIKSDFAGFLKRKRAISTKLDIN